jgi:hypothetical protein
MFIEVNINPHESSTTGMQWRDNIFKPFAVSRYDTQAMVSALFGKEGIGRFAAGAHRFR